MSLTMILRQMSNATDRAQRELPGGLWLVHYPPADGEGDGPRRLIAARRLGTPSATELNVVRDHLLEVLDAHPARVAVDVSDWRERGEGAWDGFELTYRMWRTSGAFGHDAAVRRRVRQALEAREARATKRQAKAEKATRRRPAQSGPEPML